MLGVTGGSTPFPPALEGYTGEQGLSLGQVLLQRAQAEPLNAIATLIFLLAVLHTFLAPRLMALSRRLAQGRGPDGLAESGDEVPGQGRHSFRVELLHLLGEVEAVFGIWVVPLLAAITLLKGWPAAEAFIHQRVDFTEALFVVVVMAISASRPVLALAERAIGALAAIFGRTPLDYWLAILTVGPLLGSLITEPAAMIICALLLARHLYALDPSPRLAYATLGLLFVNVSVGGTLTNFAAPPVLMVARPWSWSSAFMFRQFGWKAVCAILLSNGLAALVFRKEFARLRARAVGEAEAPPAQRPVPAWVTLANLAFLAFTVFSAHTPALFVGGFLFFLAFVQATAPHQSAINLRAPLLVGFFLAGLVVHGALQQWWIAPLLGRLSALPLMLGATVLTAFNDNAAITYLAALVPGFTDTLKYAVVAGAVTGGGLTVIANAPNPAGQALLARYFGGSISPTGLFLGALGPTVVMALCFLLL